MRRLVIVLVALVVLIPSTAGAAKNPGTVRASVEYRGKNRLEPIYAAALEKATEVCGRPTVERAKITVVRRGVRLSYAFDCTDLAST